jgi:hypothetical protein
MVQGVPHDILEAAGAQDVLVIDGYAHLVGGCRMGTTPEDSVVDADHRGLGRAEPARRRRQRHARAGIGQPRAHDHGHRLAAGGAAGGQARRAGGAFRDRCA